MKHNNPSFAEWFQRIFNLKSGDMPSNEVLDYITPIVDVGPTARISKYATATNATSATIYTTPADKDFYITDLSLAVQTDATATNTEYSIRCTIDGVIQRILVLPRITLVAGYASVAWNLSRHIKVDRNTTITASTANNTANFAVTGCILGYTVEVTK